MDQRRAFTAFVVALIAGLAISFAGAASVSAPPLREMRWINPGLPRAEVVRELTTEPAECLVAPADVAQQK